jgi:CheY-like chemotaxis protein
MPLLKRLILVVEDDDDVALVVAVMLRDARAQCVRASTLEEAMYCLTKGLPYDCILTDLVMPDGSGYGLLNEARRLGIPIVAMSGALDAYLAKKSGFDGQLAKPFDKSDLVEALEGVMGFTSQH